MSSFKNGAPVYPKAGANVNIFIPANQVDVGAGRFNAYSLSLNGDYLDNIGSSTKEGEMIKYYQIKSRFDKPDYTDPNLSFGTFTGRSIEFNGSIYHQINWNHEWFTHGFLGFSPRLQTETVGNAYVLDRDVQAMTQTDLDKAQKTQDDKEFEKYLADLVGGDEKKGLTASGATGIASNTTNVILGLVIFVVVALIGVGTYRKLKK